MGRQRRYATYRIPFVGFAHIVETKKGFARGGHFHKFSSTHILISGFIEYREKNIHDNQEHIKKIKAPAIIQTQSNIAHLFAFSPEVKLYA